MLLDSGLDCQDLSYTHPATWHWIEPHIIITSSMTSRAEICFQGVIYAPCPHFGSEGIFHGRGGGVCLRTPVAGILYAPRLYTPPHPARVLTGVGVGSVQNVALSCPLSTPRKSKTGDVFVANRMDECHTLVLRRNSHKNCSSSPGVHKFLHQHAPCHSAS